MDNKEKTTKQKEKTNSKEQKIINNPFYQYSAVFNADWYIDDFVKRVENETVTNDGKDPFLRIIDEYVLTEETTLFHKTITPGTKLYRARIVDLNDNPDIDEKDGLLKGLAEGGSREAPLGLGGAGRNNIAGMSYLYVANNFETACAEVKPIPRQLISVAEFEVRKPLKIIDLTAPSDNNDYNNNQNRSTLLSQTITRNSDSGTVALNLGAFFNGIAKMFFTPIADPAQYRATQVLTDYIRKTGADGVSYNSFFSEKGINYTIFNSDRRNIEFIDSRLIMLQNERRTFLDFNNERCVKAESLGGASYDRVSAGAMQQQIIQKIHQIQRNQNALKSGQKGR